MGRSSGRGYFGESVVGVRERTAGEGRWERGKMGADELWVGRAR